MKRSQNLVLYLSYVGPPKERRWFGLEYCTYMTGTKVLKGFVQYSVETKSIAIN